MLRKFKLYLKLIFDMEVSDAGMGLLQMWLQGRGALPTKAMPSLRRA